MEVPEDTPVSIYHGLVREAYDAQEAFDMWDEGKTVSGFVVGGQRCAREVDLKTVIDEWDLANLKLVRHVLDHGEVLFSHFEGGSDA